MGNTNFPGGASPSSPTGAFSSDTGEVYSNSISIPQGRIAASGAGPVLMYAVRAWIAGRTTNVTCYIRVGGVESAGFTNGIDDTNPPPQTAYQGISGLVANGAALQVALRASGAYRFGRGGGGTTYKPGTGFTWSDGSLVGDVLWVEVPSAPTSPSVTPTGTPGEVTFNWAAPASDGGSAVTGYRAEWSLSPTFASGVSGVDLGVVTSTVISGLTPGSTYYFRVVAKNAVTTAAATTSVASSTVSALLGTVPGAPTGVAVTPRAGGITVTWTAPASDGGLTIDAYRLDVATDSGFTSIVGTYDALGNGARAKSVPGLIPDTTYYARVRAHNSIGYSANSAGTPNGTTPARGVLDIVQSAAIHLADGTQVELRSDGANTPVITLYYLAPVGTGASTATGITVPTNGGAGTFATLGGPRNLALVADASGNLFVIGADAADTSKVLVKRYERTTSTTWTLDGTLSQSLTNTGDPLVAFAAAYVPGTGGGPTPSILMLTRRAGTIAAGALSYATLDLTAIEASTGSLFLTSGNDPSWLSTPPSSGTYDSGTIDAAPLVEGSTRVGILANGYAIVNVANGAVTTLAKAGAGVSTAGPWARVVGVNATTVVVLTVSGGALAWAFYDTTGSLLGSGSYAGANAFGGAFGSQWDAYYDRVANVITVYYVADPAGARTLESIDISPTTYTNAAFVALTAALGAASSTNAEIRVGTGVLDERRIRAGAANLLTGVKSYQAYTDTSGNVVPNAPALTDIVGFDASQSYTLPWSFSDGNPVDAQTAYELQVQRVSDSVNVVATGKVVSTSLNRVIAAATLVNGVNYRWRVRTYDALDTVGAWSAYDNFTTAAIGTLTIINPVADNPVGLDLAAINLTWSYVQVDGYVQTQRRIRVINVATAAVISDTTMQASVATSASVSVPTDIAVRIELSIVTNAPGTPTVTVNRLLTSSYSTPMQPVANITLGESYISIEVSNPAPTGSKPEVVTNLIERRLSGTADAFVAIAVVGHNGEYNDHAVRSGVAYDYQVRGRTA